MTLRYLATAGRTILSKAGFAADPALDDRNKIFDSNWNFSAVVIKSGEISDPAPIYVLGGGFLRPANTTSAAPLVIDFTDPGYIPCAYLISERDAAPNAAGSPISRGFNGFKSVAPIGGSRLTPHGAEPYVTRSQIIVPRAVSPDISGTYVRYEGIVRYVVFGISQ
jgi:hypothetical protein